MGYMDAFYKDVERVGVVPVVVLDRVEDALPVADVLVRGGLPSAEVTFRTACAADAIREMSEKRPNLMVGAGTVLTLDQARRAVDAGARYIVTPGYNMEVVDWCLANEVPVLPAGVTPTEVTALVNKGLAVTKFFPAAQYGGLATIKALASVFVGHRFMPTGGVSTANLREYLECPAVLACGGTWMVKPDLIRSGDFDRMYQLTREAALLVREVRG
ncbi:bifunctional 4-hydroxy-2-oxoglutarate aldolase/2-dehydro-3-deoxy-phosphogluconate aldolase [Thermophilibacter gallinarum]|nr:bifunctional 4-hydroxy-2-oxoglutarate aldolase/2-dehydro-3-deoxy-phosphogluconate aldolase [Thermophilibacter gallinarum]